MLQTEAKGLPPSNAPDCSSHDRSVGWQLQVAFDMQEVWTWRSSDSDSLATSLATGEMRLLSTSGIFVYKKRFTGLRGRSVRKTTRKKSSFILATVRALSLKDDIQGKGLEP